MSLHPSILQDRDLGRPMEIDGIYGATLELARLGGMATPVFDLLVAPAKLRARAAGFIRISIKSIDGSAREPN